MNKSVFFLHRLLILSYPVLVDNDIVQCKVCSCNVLLARELYDNRRKLALYQCHYQCIAALQYNAFMGYTELLES